MHDGLGSLHETTPSRLDARTMGLFGVYLKLKNRPIFKN